MIKRIALLMALCFVFVLPAFAQHSVALSWVASVAAVPPAGQPAVSATGYFVYRATGACATGLVFAQLNATALPATATTYTDGSAALVANGAYCYQITAVSAAGVQSIPSNQVTATIPGPPAPPTGLTVTSVN